MIDNQEFDKISINYFGIDWVLENNELICTNTHFADLFKSNPADLYINWAAAMQIQFHVCDLPQDYKNTTQEWSKAYLQHFVSAAQKRAKDMIDKFVTPFEKYT
jgi:type II restriction enzyme